MNSIFQASIINGTRNCTQPAIDDFPKDIFTPEQRLKGAIIFHIATSLYLFVALAVVCDKYFVPAVEKICQALNMSNDVAGATFMAAATSAPELFVNVIGTFITEGDIGIGTIVGSAVFNILAVAACCGLTAITVIPLHWWPLTRDCVAYGITVIILICIIHDEIVDWYEALLLVILYAVYIAVMYWDKQIQHFFCGEENDKPSPEEKEVKTKNELVILESDEKSKKNSNVSHENAPSNGTLIVSPEAEIEEQEHDGVLGLLSFPVKRDLCKYCLWIIILPIYTVFLFTIPDCTRKRFKRWFPLTFIMCIIWIGSLSYVVAWMITVVGDTLKIPDSVMGITFLAAGTSVPEAVSSVIVAKQGHGDMGISNSLGSNTFDILLCLGLPWLIKASLLPTSKGHHYIGINSRGLEYSALSLLSTLLLLYGAFAINKFRLDKKVGYTCLVMYIIFLVSATLIELNVFFVVNLPTCQH